MRYFAYGSNLLRSRIEERLGAVGYEGVAILPGHVLRFHKHGRDGSAKAGVVATGHPCDVVFGALYRLSPGQFTELDAIEGPGYRRASALVETSGRDTSVPARLYLARESAVVTRLKPFDWYRDLVLQGAIANRFPAFYLDAILQIPVIRDDRTNAAHSVVPPEGRPHDPGR